FGGSPDVLGRRIVFNGRPMTIVGVGPRDYAGGIQALAADAWVTLRTSFAVSRDRADRETRRGSRSLFLKARLADGVTIEQARAAMDVVAGRLAAAYPDTNHDRRVVLYPSAEVRFHPAVDRALAPVALLLMAVPGLVLLIACANIANLMLARASGRTREVAIRIAVGAGRRRLIQQLLTESVTLALAGGTAGLAVAWALTAALVGWKPDGLPVPISLDLAVDQRVVSFTLLVSLATGVLFGLAPALQATRPDVVPALKDEGAGSLRRHKRYGLRNGLVVAQVAVSLVLLTAAGLFVRSLENAQDIDPGFERERAIILTPLLSLTGVDDEAARTVTERLAARLAALPGVEAVGLAERVPLGASIHNRDILVGDQQPDASGRGTSVDVTTIGPGYLRALGIPLLRGRNFADTDRQGGQRVALVSDAFARRFFPDEDALGQLVRFPPGASSPQPAPAEIVGIVRDTRVQTLGEAPRPYLYLAWRQEGGDMSFVVRTAGAADPMVEVVRRTALEVDPALPILEMKTMSQHLGLMLTPPRLAAGLLGVFGTLAICLACLGLYAVVAFSVARRTREIGIRVALGASQREVLWLVVREGMTLVGVGVAVGLLLAVAAARPLGAYLYGLGGFDLVTFGAVAAILVGTALVANYLPARRAARIDPLRAIRCE
ncbi:MAG: ABC transporter permease, partial [Vicinamibacterales bacterium]